MSPLLCPYIRTYVYAVIEISAFEVSNRARNRHRSNVSSGGRRVLGITDLLMRSTSGVTGNELLDEDDDDEAGIFNEQITLLEELDTILLNREVQALYSKLEALSR